jgi:tripartite-type tricarboxylate transporter receptor subunit TctC
MISDAGVLGSRGGSLKRAAGDDNRKAQARSIAIALPVHDENGYEASICGAGRRVRFKAIIRRSMAKSITHRGRITMFARTLAAAVGIAALCGALQPARAADYPTKPITLIIGFAPGGPSDVLARILTRKMEEILKTSFVIENRPGAGGSIAGAAVARATPDGYTLLLGTGSLLAINVSFYKNLGYDPEKDFEPITLIGTQTNVLYVHPSVPAKSLAELIDYAKANPGKLSFGSGGNGTPAHLAGELLKIEAKIDMTHVPFRGTGPALQNVIAGHVPMAFNPPSPLIPHIQSGAIRPIAITTLKRTVALPEVPTIAELGFPGFEATTWHALVAPAGTPREVTATLHRAIAATLNDADVRKALTDLGVDVVGNAPEELRAYIKSEIPKWAAIVKASGAKLE